MTKTDLMKPETRLIEVVLFIENEPMTLQAISETVKMPEAEVKSALEEIKAVYENSFHGLALKFDSVAKTYSFAPSEDLYDGLRKIYGRKVDRRLSRAALETLAIVAYKQPITRREIMEIRGTSSDNIVSLLREREYIKVVGRKDENGHPCLYGTSRKFLYEFNLQSISDLPKLSEIDRMRFDEEKEEEENE
jgi:segregation and condensation protein B